MDQKNQASGGLSTPPFLLNMDMFGSALPTFNLKGKTEIRTACGGTVSLMIIYITFLFASLKLVHLVTKHGPLVNSFEIADAYGFEDIFSSADENFMLAVSLEDYFT